MTPPERLIVVSNRLPITIEARGEQRSCHPSDGGLVSALTPILSENGGCWIGWTGSDQDEELKQLVRKWSEMQPYAFEPVFLTPEEKAYFYHGCSNEIIWPLFHGFPSRCNFDSAYWAGYCRANEKFAAAVARATGGNDFIWVHDYHLMMLARVMRARGITGRLAYFHHIPFPAPYVFEALPRRAELLQALMEYDLIGFQTDRDLGNFIACLHHCLPEVYVTAYGQKFLVRAGSQQTLVSVDPISIDFATFASEASGAEVASVLKSIRDHTGVGKIILGVDRLDYTKGIPERLLAFQTLLQQHPELRGHVTMMQLVVPSREDIPEYAQLKDKIEMLVSKINGEYGGPGWIPVQYFHRRISRAELIALYRSARIALVTPLRDGMNLVAKEFCAARIDRRGVLVLSEFAGAAAELRCGALLVNPNDTDGVAASLYAGLMMDETEERARMDLMRAHISKHDVFHWAESFCSKTFEFDEAIESDDHHSMSRAVGD